MWAEIGNTSGLPFYPSLSCCSVEPRDKYHLSEIRADNLKRELDVKAKEMDLMSSERDLFRKETEELKSSLHDATCRASVAEIEVVNEKDRREMLSGRVSVLQTENEDLKNKLQQFSDSIIAKEEYTLTLESQCEKWRETEEKLHHQLKKYEESEQLLKKSHENTVMELRSWIEGHKKVEKQLRDSLDQLEKQRLDELNSLREDANNKITLLESNLKNASFKLERAEIREREALGLAQQAKKEVADMVESMHKTIADDRKKYHTEMMSIHNIEIKKYASQLDVNRKENARLSAEIVEVKSSIEKQIKDFTDSLQQADARNATLDQKLKKESLQLCERTKQCDRLLVEINECREDNTDLQTKLDSMKENFENMKSSKERDTQTYQTKINSLHAQLKEKNSKLDQERAKFSATVEQLESNAIACIKQIFSTIM
mmetsp:Transcript_7049/g.15363  ORF Transcript_7049/g.15363 Transcript_7049/m.15363 type:complete len:431 (+) Transcript_7049:88-1380(+)